MSIARNIPALLVVLIATPTLGQGPVTKLRFNQDIRPILSENCFHCHGPDEDAREADLRLDTEVGAKESAIVVGDPESSELIDRILSDDPNSQMPPPESERSLTKEQKNRLIRWIKEGAQYESHWSFIPPKLSPLPKTESASAHAIDRFVWSKLAEMGFKQAPEADRETLIRRATFDLTGLPPTLQEIDDFLADKSDNSYERLLDRLLSRREYGERMASDWLDAARYSDTYGYQVDRDRYVWPWRDWVIQAFNDNLPYDQFVTEQLAGDLLPNATRDQILATTFNRLHPQKVEGGSVEEEFRMEYVADRTQTIATALMGLTMECCRCHSHKYDPFTQKEYYELSAFFDKIDEAGLYSYFTPSIPTPTLALPTEQQEQSLQQYALKVNEWEQRYESTVGALGTGDSIEHWLKKHEGITVEDYFAKPIASLDFEDPAKSPNRSVEGVDGKAVQLTGDDKISTSVGNFRRFEPFSISLWIKTPDEKDRAVIFHRSRAWTDAGSRGYQLLIEDGKLSWSLIHFWPGNAISIKTVDPIPVAKWIHVAVTYDGSAKANGLGISMNGKEALTEVVRDRLTKNITGGGGDTIAIGERFRDRGFKNGLVDQFRVFDCQLTALEIRRLASGEKADSDAKRWLHLKLEPNEPLDLVADHFFHRHQEDVQAARAELRKAREAFCKVEDAVQEIMVMREMDSPRQSYVLRRGAYDDRAEPVGPGTPAVLGALADDLPQNRLGLARWMTDPAHPLTSRVAVNRLWQLCFGAGLVRTPEDFGSQGDPPTHPELLDWLAVDFVRGGWDMKRTLKQIMMSATYRQSSQPVGDRITKQDPENRFLGYFPSYRLPAEMLRDNALAVSGRLVSRMGGPPVKPYEIEASFKPAKRDRGDGLYRRSIYTYWKRTGPAPAMMALDASKRDVCRVQRERTSSPLQAFVLLNGPQYVEAARGLAEQLANEHGQDEEAVGETLGDAFRVLTSRHASDAEVSILAELYRKQLEYFQADSERATEYLRVGDATADKQLNADRLAALTVVVSTIMNFDQSVMKR